MNKIVININDFEQVILDLNITKQKAIIALNKAQETKKGIILLKDYDMVKEVIESYI